MGKKVTKDTNHLPRESFSESGYTGVYFVTNHLGLYSVKVISTEIYMLECTLDKVEENEIT